MKGLAIISLIFMLVSAPGVVSANDIFKVKRIGQGNSLALRAYPGKTSKVKVSIPHNASWIIKRDRNKKVGKVLWSKVVWNDQTGWVPANNLSFDPASTKMAKQRKQCLTDPAVKNKICCGYPASERNRVFKHVDIMAVQGVPQGKTLPLRSIPGKWKGKVIVAIPHNATWIARLDDKRTLPNGETWLYVRWNGQNGWVNQANVRFDRDTTIIGDKKRKMCSTYGQ